MRRRLRGFTLIELIITIAILAILVVAVFAFLDPAGRLQRSREVKHLQDAAQIQKAIELFIGDTLMTQAKAPPPAGTFKKRNICAQGIDPLAEGIQCINLDSLVAGGYLPKIASIAIDGLDPRLSGFSIHPKGQTLEVKPYPSLSHALSFPNASAIATVAHADGAGFDLRHNQPFSLAMWLRINSSAQDSVTYEVMRKKNGPAMGSGNPGFMMQYAVLPDFPPSKKLEIYFIFCTNNSSFCTGKRYSKVNPPFGTYLPVIVTFDANGIGWNSFKMYVQNEQQTLGFGTNIINGVQSAANQEPLTFGGFHQGALDEVRFYNRVLTADERAMLSDLDPDNDDDVPGLTSYWAFDHLPGSTIAEETVGGHDAQVNGAQFIGPPPSTNLAPPFQ